MTATNYGLSAHCAPYTGFAPASHFWPTVFKTASSLPGHTALIIQMWPMGIEPISSDPQSEVLTFVRKPQWSQRDSNPAFPDWKPGELAIYSMGPCLLTDVGLEPDIWRLRVSNPNHLDESAIVPAKRDLNSHAFATVSKTAVYSIPPHRHKNRRHLFRGISIVNPEKYRLCIWA